MEDILDTPAPPTDALDPTHPATVAPAAAPPPLIQVTPEEKALAQRTSWKEDQAPAAATPQTPQRSDGWGQKFSDMWNSVKSGTEKLATSVNRVVPDTINGASDLAVGAVGGAERLVDKGVKAITGKSAMPAFDTAWDSGDIKDVNPFHISSSTEDNLFGKKPGGLYDAAEAVGTFAASLAVGSEATGVAELAPGVAKTLAHIGLGGLVQAATTDPRAARISDMIENGAPSLSNPLTQFLKSNGTDSEALGRLKNGLEGVLTGATIDTFIGGVKAVAGAIKDGGADAVADAVAGPSSPSPYTVVPQEDGTFGVKGPATAGAPLPSSASLADAEGHAASLNEAINTMGRPTGFVDDKDVTALMDAVKAAPASAGLKGVKLPSDAFNYNYLGGTKETDAVIQTLADRFQESFTGLKGRLSEGAGTPTDEFVTKATALVRQSNADSWLSGAKSDADALPAIDARQFARKIVMNQLGQKVANLSQALDVNPSNAVAGANLKAATDQLLQLGAETSGVDSGFGRSLQRLQNIIPSLKAGAESGTDATNIAGEGATPKPSFTDNFTPKDWQDLARQVRLSDGDTSLIQDAMYGSVAKKAAETSGSNAALEKVNAFRANAMLSGPRTQLKLAVSQGLSSVWSTGEYWLGGNISRAEGIIRGNSAMAAGGAQDAQFGKDALFGLTQNFRAAWGAVGKALRTGSSVLDTPAESIAADSGQEATGNSIANGAMRAVNLPTAITQANHEFFKNVDYLSAVRGLSMRAAREDLAKMDPMTLADQNTFIAGRLADDLHMSTDPTTGRALNPVALQQARDATFSAPLTGFAKAIQDNVQKYPLLRMIAPFVRTPIDLARYSWQRTPMLGLASSQMQADLAAGGLRRSAALGKQASGTMLWGTIAHWAASGNMTGGGPADPELRKQWTDSGHQPYSVRIPGTNEWLSYRGIDQLSKPMSLVSDMTEMSGETHEEVNKDIAAKFVVAASKDVTNQSFMQGVSQFSDAFASGDPNKAKALFGGLAGSFMPALGHEIDTPDNYTEIRGLMDKLKESVPHLSSTLEPRRNILGEKVIKPPGNMLQQMSPFTLAPGADINDVQEQLVQLGKGMSMPKTTVGAVDLTDRGQWKRNAQDTQSPYDRMLQLQGNMGNGMPSLRDKLTELMTSDGWAKMGAGTDQYPGGERYDAASQVIKAYQGAALDKVQEEYPGLQKAIQDSKGQSTRALAAPLTARPSYNARPSFLTPGQ